MCRRRLENRKVFAGSALRERGSFLKDLYTCGQLGIIGSKAWACIKRREGG